MEIPAERWLARVPRLTPQRRASSAVVRWTDSGPSMVIRSFTLGSSGWCFGLARACPGTTVQRNGETFKAVYLTVSDPRGRVALVISGCAMTVSLLCSHREPDRSHDGANGGVARPGGPSRTHAPGGRAPRCRLARRLPTDTQQARAVGDGRVRGPLHRHRSSDGRDASPTASGGATPPGQGSGQSSLRRQADPRPEEGRTRRSDRDGVGTVPRGRAGS